MNDFLTPWLSNLVIALEHKFQGRNAAAYTAFNEMSGVFPRNVYVLTSAGQAAAGSRQHGAETSITAFKSARSVDRFACRGMDTYSFVLQTTGDSRELAFLSQDLISLHSASSTEIGATVSGELRSPCSEAWVAAAMHSEVKGDSDRALDFINKVSAVCIHCKQHPMLCMSHLVLGY